MGVFLLNLAIFAMNNKLSLLIATDLSSGIDSITFVSKVTTGSFRAALLYIPTTIRIGNNMMRSNF